MKTNDLKTKQKKEALERMRIHGLHSKCIRRFKFFETVSVSEPYGILRVPSSEEKHLVARFEEKRKALVYHVLKNETPYGTIYTLLFVSDDIANWESQKNDIKTHWVWAWCENVTIPKHSEFGMVLIHPMMNGSLVREW